MLSLFVRSRPPAPGRRSLENPSTPLGDVTALEALYGSAMSTTGIQVNHSKALTLAAVWQAVSMISGDVAKLPLSVYRRLANDGRETAGDHPSHVLVRRRSNLEMPAFQFWRQLLADALLWGNGYAWIRHEGMRPVELVPLLPDRTEPVATPDGLYYVTEAGNERRAFEAAEVLHVRGMTRTRDARLTEAGASVGAMSGADLVGYARDSIGLALAAEGFNAKFFKHGARSAGLLELPAGLSKTAKDQVEEGFRKFHEGEDNWFRTVVLRDGAKFHQLSFSARDAETHQLREDQVRDVARWFNLSPSRLGLSDSVSYNSKAEDNQSYLDTTLSPWLEAIASECWLKLLLPPEQRGDTHYFEHNTAALLRMNAKERAEIYHYAIADGWLSRNEARRKENMDAVDGLDEYLVPANLGPASQLGEPAHVDTAAPVRTARRRAIALLADHARKKARDGHAFASWVDGGLTWHRTNWAETVGDGESEFFEPLLQRLNLLLDTTTEEELSANVDRLFTEIEEAE